MFKVLQPYLQFLIYIISYVNLKVQFKCFIVNSIFLTSFISQVQVTTVKFSIGVNKKTNKPTSRIGINIKQCVYVCVQVETQRGAQWSPLLVCKPNIKGSKTLNAFILYARIYFDKP